MSFLKTVYLAVFSRPSFQKRNDKILAMCLKARGYNNFSNQGVSGEAHFIRNILSKFEPSVCVDVGANQGRYARQILEYTSSTVYAFEPLMEPYAELEKIKSEYDGRLVTIQKGVGACNECLTINYNPNSTTHASFSKIINEVSYVDNDQTTQVDVVTIDKYFSEQHVESIDFLKIDTEGFEHEVLVGAQETIKAKNIKFIQIECNWHHLFRSQSLWSLSRLLPGYVPFQLLSGRLVERDPRDPLANIYQFSNFVFIRKDLKNKI